MDRAILSMYLFVFFSVCFVFYIVLHKLYLPLSFCVVLIFTDEVAAYELKQKEAEAKKERLYVTSKYF